MGTPSGLDAPYDRWGIRFAWEQFVKTPREERRAWSDPLGVLSDPASR